MCRLQHNKQHPISLSVSQNYFRLFPELNRSFFFSLAYGIILSFSFRPYSHSNRVEFDYFKAIFYILEVFSKVIFFFFNFSNNYIRFEFPGKQLFSYRYILIVIISVSRRTERHFQSRRFFFLLFFFLLLFDSIIPRVLPANNINIYIRKEQKESQAKETEHRRFEEFE